MKEFDKFYSWDITQTRKKCVVQDRTFKFHHAAEKHWGTLIKGMDWKYRFTQTEMWVGLYIFTTRKTSSIINVCEMRCRRSAADLTLWDRMRNHIIRRMIGTVARTKHTGRQKINWFGHLRMPHNQLHVYGFNSTKYYSKMMPMKKIARWHAKGPTETQNITALCHKISTSHSA